MIPQIQSHRALVGWTAFCGGGAVVAELVARLLG